LDYRSVKDCAKITVMVEAVSIPAVKIPGREFFFGFSG